MLVLDYLIANEDRHLNNFGAVRNACTLEWLGCAPIYDSGTSLWFDKPWTMINAGAKASSKPFKTTHDEQIKLCAGLLGRVERLARVMEERRGSYPVDDRSADVTENVAYSGEEMER